MAPLNEMQDLEASWRALRETGSASEGWRTIPLSMAAPVQVAAGVRFPGREEALLAGFRIKPAGELPHGNGFAVDIVSGQDDGPLHWLSLTRAPAASLEIFRTMAEDLMSLLREKPLLEEGRRLHLFLGRIRAWQAFMSRTGKERLGPEAELGLCGELSVLEELLNAGLTRSTVAAAWTGPLQSVHDFALGIGAIEVKTTLSGASFPASISSLEQLDDGLLAPLFLAAIRASLQAGALDLPERVEALRSRFQSDQTALALFEQRLMLVGYNDDHSKDYVRRIATTAARILPVDERMPRLLRTTTAPAIRAAAYEIDLDMVSVAPTPLPEVLRLLGMRE